jgi:type I restriction enzyme, S subunit
LGEKRLSEVCEIKPPKKEAKDILKDTDLVSFLPMADLGVCEKTITPMKSPFPLSPNNNA